MCLLCIASRWSRRVALTLPWLIMATIVLWAFSQLLPQGLYNELTSHRLACVGMLLISLGWYELIMPKVYEWHAGRRAIWREKRRAEEQEALKRRKKATRRCRNCFTAYKDQNPGGGRFMCTYCGHVSKRPVLDMPVGAPSSRSLFSLPGSAVDFFNGNRFFAVRSPISWYGRGSLAMPSWAGGRSWIGSAPWIDGVSWGVSSSWFGGTWPGSALNFGNTGLGWTGSGTFMGSVISGYERYAAGESYFGVFWFLLRVISQLFVCAIWIWRKLSRAENEEEDVIDGCHDSRVEKTGPLLETRGVKARRKAEEKRIARLEKEHLEAEERKQREEVARLVEERRRQRDQKQVAAKRTASEAVTEAKREIRREGAEMGKQDKKETVLAKEKFKERDLGDSKENVKFGAVKILKATKDSGVKEVDVGEELAANSFSKWESSKNQGSSKGKFFFQSKDVAANRKNLSERPTKAANIAVTSSSSSTPSTRLSSSWSWSNVWCKRASKVGEPSSKRVAKLEATNKRVECCSEGVKDTILNNNVLVCRSSCPQKQPRASSSFPVSGDNCLSCLSPTELPMDFMCREQGLNNLGREINKPPLISSLSVYSHEPSASMAQIPFANTYSNALEASTSSVPSNVSSSCGKNIHNSPSFLGPLMCTSANETELNSVLPIGIFGMGDPESSKDLACKSAFTKEATWDPWSASIDGMLGQRMQDKWHHCDSIYSSRMNFAHPSPSNSLLKQRHDIFEPLSPSMLQSNPLCQQKHDTFEPLSPSMLQTNADPESYLPSTLFAFEEIDDVGSSCQNSICGTNFSLNASKMEPIMCAWEDIDMYHKVPPEFVDCITQSIMQDPVITADGHSYERSAIEAWLKSHDTSPITGEILPPSPGGNGNDVDKTLRPNHILRAQIMEFKERLVKRCQSNEGLVFSSWVPAMTARTDTLWPTENNGTESFRNFYPNPAGKSAWCRDLPGG